MPLRAIYDKLENVSRLSQKLVGSSLFAINSSLCGDEQRRHGLSCILIAMQVSLVHIGQRPGARDRADELTADYLQRCSAFARCDGLVFRSPESMLEWLDKRRGRTPATTVLCDWRGRQMSSEAFARWIGSQRDRGAQHLILAVGPPDGWSDAAHKRADLLLSLGPMTLPHALARLVLAEQLYRAFTILAGHPYHCGH
jgi:23S rRNA (pseudouridine1915-N3)-methyltransferase